MKRIYACIDLKSFYASVECHERGLDPLNTNLVVADNSRTEKTICLAVTPSLKQYGLKGRSRLFEVVSKVKEINNERKKNIKYKPFRGKSYLDSELKNDSYLELEYIVAKPQMKLYMDYSTKIYNVYLKYFSKEDIYVYSIDEVFIDLTNYLSYYQETSEKLISRIIRDVYNNTGITATAGIGTNMYLAKICMDIVAKHMAPNDIGVRLASIDEVSFRTLLWDHQPLTDFWRIGPGIAKKLNDNRMYTMRDIARCSIDNEDLLYKLFGVNAELIIDHAWGYEPTTIKDIGVYKPMHNSISSGQVLHEPYEYTKARLIIKEMADNLALDLVDRRLVTKQLVMHIIYDVANLTDKRISAHYFGEVVKDQYGRLIPKHSHGTINLKFNTSSSKLIIKYATELFDQIVNPLLLVRKINITACDVVSEEIIEVEEVKEQLNLFSNQDTLNNIKLKKEQQNENRLQHTLIDIKNKYGKNAILKGMNYCEGATMRDRNRQVGGHNA